MDNVNNLNGVPNFGHGYLETTPEVVSDGPAIPTMEEEPSVDEVEIPTETKVVKAKKGKKK